MVHLLWRDTATINNQTTVRVSGSKIYKVEGTFKTSWFGLLSSQGIVEDANCRGHWPISLFLWWGLCSTIQLYSVLQKHSSSYGWTCQISMTQVKLWHIIHVIKKFCGCMTGLIYMYMDCIIRILCASQNNDIPICCLACRRKRIEIYRYEYKNPSWAGTLYKSLNYIFIGQCP